MAKTDKELKKENESLKARVKLLEYNMTIAKNSNYADWERHLLYKDDGIKETRKRKSKDSKPRRGSRERNERNSPNVTKTKSKRSIKKELYENKANSNI